MLGETAAQVSTILLATRDKRRKLFRISRLQWGCETTDNYPRPFVRGIHERTLMPKLIVLYPLPADATLFERRYRLEHAPMVTEKIPGLKKFVSSQVLGTPTGAAPYQRVAELYFDSLESLQAAMASDEGKAAVAHATEISTGGSPVVLIAEDDKPL